MTTNTYIKYLTNLKSIVGKAREWSVSCSIKEEAILTARLSLDQFTFIQQIRSVTNHAVQGTAVLYNVEALKFEDTEVTLLALEERITKALLFIDSVIKNTVANDLETRMVPLYWAPGKGLVAKYFVEEYTISNFYFHYVTAYSILRHYGLPIGKADYMGKIELQDLV